MLIEGPVGIEIYRDGNTINYKVVSVHESIMKVYNRNMIKNYPTYLGKDFNIYFSLHNINRICYFKKPNHIYIHLSPNKEYTIIRLNEKDALEFYNKLTRALKNLNIDLDTRMRNKLLEIKNKIGGDVNGKV